MRKRAKTHFASLNQLNPVQTRMPGSAYDKSTDGFGKGGFVQLGFRSTMLLRLR